ncbi:LysR family transcriptional regulator [Rothia terrae]|uniref:LysR family transcriptional regulator n=1 Tax=Rothia terrae TaxID=396015 RepID=A0A7H2BBT5_9MICC|nr:LysR family transcriptional regulator [Rothia terrae]QNV37131.1 LysR family transcriptional regulator [Rothia terrae]
MYDIRRLNMLLEVHERGTVAAAAKTLHLTSSAVSQQLSQLEKEAGTPLLTHVGRRLQLTAAGQVLVDGTRSVLKEFDSMKTAMERLSGEPAGTVRIAIFQSAALALLPLTLEHLQQHAPQVTLHVVQIEPEIGLSLTKSREFDLTIAETYPSYYIPEIPELAYDLIAEDPLYAITAEDAGIMHLKQASEIPWVLENKGNTSREWAINLCRSEGFDPKIQYEIDDVMTHVHLVQAGYTAAVIPGFIARTAQNLDNITMLKTSHQYHRKIYAVSREENSEQLSITAVKTALKWAAQHKKNSAFDQ